MKQKAVLSILITVLLAVPAVFLGGCATGQVVPPFNPQQIKPEPYNPTPEWNDRTDPNLLALQQIKQKTGQTMAPGAKATTTGATTGGTTGGVTPVPGPAPGPPPTPAGRVPSTSDLIFGYVYDRIEGGVISGATVTLLGSRGETVDSIKTNAAGLYSFQAVQSGSSYKVQASASGYLQIPLSYFEFIYPAVSNPIGLYLAYASPFQELPGASYTALGLGYTSTPTVSHFDRNGDIAGHYGDVMQTDFYSASTQKTYRAVLYDYIGTGWGDGFCSRGWAQYTFALPGPNSNKYSFDGLWLSLPESYAVNTSGVWAAGGTGTVYYLDWSLSNPPTTNVWISSGSTQALTFVQPPWWAVCPSGIYAGLVSVTIISDQDDAIPPAPWVLTTVKLAYDYHKDMTAPTIRSYYYVSSSKELVIQFSENAYITLIDNDDESKVVLTNSHFSPMTFSENMPIDATTINIVEVPSGLTGNYTLTLTDQAGNTSAVTLTII